MKSILYLFRRFKVASTLNVLGVALALAGCYLLLTQIYFIRSYNHGIKDYENIYCLEIFGLGDDEWQFIFNRPFITELSKLPQLTGLEFSNTKGGMLIDKNGTRMTVDVSLMSDSLLLLFGAERVDGRTYTHHKEEGVIIPASLAEEYFGDKMAAGKQMTIVYGDNSYKKVNVIGVYADFPENSIASNCVYESVGDMYADDPNEWDFLPYMHFRPDVDIDSVNSIIRGQVVKMMKDDYAAGEISKAEMESMLKRMEVRTMPLSETYMNGHNPMTDRGSKTTLFILELAVLLLVLISIINFTNYSTAQAPMRLRGINTRKVIGESILSIRTRLVIEGILVCVIAFAFAMLVDYSVSLWSAVGQYVLGSIALTDHWCIALIVLGIGVLTGIISTIFSAYYVTSFQPAMVLKGGFGLSPRGKSVRQLLIGFQFVIAFVMVILVGVIYSQSFYIRNSDYGYDKDVLLFGGVYDVPSEKKSALAQELKRINGVENVAYCSQQLGVGDFTMKWGRMEGNVQMSYFVIPCDWRFFSTCGIKIKEGRNFRASDGDVYIINDAMRKKWRNISKLEEKPIVGVCENIRVFSIRIDNANTPTAFLLMGKEYTDRMGDRFSNIYIRIAPNTDKIRVRKQIEEIIKKFSLTNDSSVHFLDEKLEHVYHDEHRFMVQMRISTLLVFIITIIGVFCLTMFETEYRRKEIAIRKVMGSSVGEVIALFTRRYTLPLVISFVVAAPVAYYLGVQWLKNFAEHTPIYWWIFPLAFVLVSLVVILTVVVQCWRVATMNPVDSIKGE